MTDQAHAIDQTAQTDPLRQSDGTHGDKEQDLQQDQQPGEQPEQQQNQPSHQPRQRRRGEELEAALLTAAWQELVDAGFARLTMESIAARAKTGVAVLYRRWSNKDDLVLAAIRHYGTTHPVKVPDTGSLREDMVAFLTRVSESRTGFVAVVAATFTGLTASTGLTPAELRERLMSDGSRWSDQILERAERRGEVDLAAVPPAVLAMPFDLMRHEMLMTYKPIRRERVVEIVDDLFMPLVDFYKGKSGTGE